MVMQSDLRVEEMDMQLNSVAINPLSAAFANDQACHGSASCSNRPISTARSTLNMSAANCKASRYRSMGNQ